ncbi:MAG: fatty acid oxidation complex subunit alpha FadJ [Acidimicrobiia bacterium]|nr:fatty acid oxidation complex subunit alpha FadJ [Acidimicrobiia bacterium]
MTNELTHFQLTVDDGIATVLMDRAGEPMNTLGPVIFDDFNTVLDRLETDDSIEAVVWGSAKKDFLVGADIRWFAELTDAIGAEKTILAAHEMFARVERLHTKHGKPVIAAISGACLGGGTELALCASSRICTDHPKTQLGQPEVQLGIIPAGGGTQRLPALIGIADALDLILTGRPARSRKAKSLGLVDEVVPTEKLMEVATRRAREAIESPDGRTKKRSLFSMDGIQELALEANPVGRNVLFKQAKDKLLKQTKGLYPAPERALEAVRIGIEDGPAAGYAAEARFFGELVVSPESLALRSIFFSSRSLERETWVAQGVEPKQVSKVAMIGGGLMGGGIAAVTTLKAQTPIRIKEIDTAGVGRALAYVQKVIGGQVKRKRLRDFEGEKAMLRVTGSTGWRGFEDSDLVIEAVFENIELKQSILREVEAITRPDTVFASNTSSLPITSIASASSRPETVLGMHYFSPVDKMPLLEIIVTDQTADWATATAVEFGKKQGKTVIVVKDGTGFYTTRVLGPYSNEAMYLLAEGASVEAIDKAMVGWGFPVGPVLLADEVGIDVGAKIAVILIDAFGERMRGPSMMEGLISDDRKGRKNGRGFYLYDDKGQRGDVDQTVYAALGLGPRTEISPGEIQKRLWLAFANEAARCLEEGILGSARDGDIGAVMGLGFPPFRGGPFFWIDQVGADRVVSDLEDLAARHGDRFTPAKILTENARNGDKFRAAG